MKTSIWLSAVVVSTSSLAAIGLFGSGAALDRETITVPLSDNRLATTTAALAPANPNGAAPVVNPALLSRQTKLEQQQQRLAQELATLREQNRQLVVRLDELTSAPATADPVEPGPPVADPLAQKQALNDRFVALESALQAQYPDPDWSQDTEFTIDESLAPLLPQDSGGELLTVECRSSLCRIESVHETAASLYEFMEQASFAVGWDHSQMARIDDRPDGSANLVMIISRDGHDLPQRR